MASQENTIEISIVVPTFNRKAVLLRTLGTIFDQDLDPGRFEVVVVVDGSADGTSEALRSLAPACAFKVVEQTNKGQASARNVGWRAATGKYVLFLDDDMLCESALVRKHLEAHHGSESDVVFGRTPIAQECAGTALAMPLVLDAAYIADRLQKNPQAKIPDDTMICSNVSLARRLLQSSGGYDERYFRWFEDIDLGLRLLATGAAFRYEPGAVALHLFSKAPEAAIRDQFWCGRNSVLLCRKYPEMRPHSLLTRLDDGPRWKQLARLAAVSAPALPHLLLRVAFAGANTLPQTPSVKRLVLWLHGIRCRIEFLRGAIEESGSAEAYAREFNVSRGVHAG